jgi:hypothetical protein
MKLQRVRHLRRCAFQALARPAQIGRLLIAPRIARGLGRHELAERLGVSESLVPRGERNEYHGITVECARRIWMPCTGPSTLLSKGQ